MLLILKITLGILFLELVSAQLNNPIVETSLGKIKGTILKTEKDREFYAFRGIRYAESPIGDERFKAPIAVTKPWNGEYDATKDGYMCPQVGPSEDLLSEDCLIVNVYTTNLNASKPVIVYIHGGSDKDGGSHSVREAGPEYLMETEIVLVSLNYRLNALGFLTTRTSEAPGNFGFLDQIMALKWVHENIEHFGGNSSSVTIFGASAGGMAVTLHVASPLSRGLFHRAIAMSGSAVNEQAIDNLHWTRKLAHETSCPMFNPEDLLSCLRKVPWQTIVQISKRWDLYGFADMKWNYEVDGHFLDFPPTKYFAQGNFSHVPILTGLTKEEFRIMSQIHYDNPGLLNDIDFNLEKYSREFFMHDFGDPIEGKVEKLKTFYFKNESMSTANLEKFGEALTDSFINHGVHRLVDLARKFVPVYYYRFDYKGSYGMFPNISDVYHGEEQIYIFKTNKPGAGISVKDKEWQMIETMVGIISTFAQNGVPPEFDNLKWQPSNQTDVNTLYINETLKMDSPPFAERFQLWDNLFPVENIGSRLSICLTIMLIGVSVVFSVFV
ncbi:juvenile hormone esterase-like [Episyrphus balteatus]|uniref:juvenile hormone esterase-like n=1 Tax=Episyrphus balteatus TaxID=286459 RepID=UPI002485051B|nr:juvenile hormone esterase-like [Episyrphus balteatus]